MMNLNDRLLNHAASSFLKKMRKRNGITEKELAVLLKISQQQVSRYENGKTQLTIVRINQYLETFNVGWDYFIHELLDHIKLLKCT